MGVPITITDPNGLITTMQYDAFGRLTKIFKPGDLSTDPSTYYRYCDYVGAAAYYMQPFLIGELHKPASPNPIVIRHFYDGLGREVQTQSALSVTIGSDPKRVDIMTSRSFDARGLLISQTVPYTAAAYTYYYWLPNPANPYTTTNRGSAPKSLTQYDAAGRATQVTNPDGTVTKMAYAGLQTAVLDANGHQRVNQTDIFGQLIQVREFTGVFAAPTITATAYATTTYDYNTLGNLTNVTDAQGNVTTINYDAFGRKTDMIDPDMGYWQYEYDLGGNLITQTDNIGQVLWFKYDKLNRMIEKREDAITGTLLASYMYDVGAYAKGRRASMSDLSGATQWRYDWRGRVISETKTINGAGGGTFTTLWNYDLLDRPITMTYPGGNAGQQGETVAFTYNPQSLITGVVGSNLYVQNTTYDAAGRADLRVLGNNSLQQDFIYFPWTTANGQGRLQQMKTGTITNATSLQDLRYTYDAIGNVMTIQDWKAGSPQTQNFHYDWLDRLQDANATGGISGTYGTDTFTYDEIGNILSKSGVGSYTYAANPSGCVGASSIKPHAVSQAGSFTYAYDCNGNMIDRSENGSTYTQIWDQDNRLITVTGSATAAFVYDGDGVRVKATLNGATTAYIGNYYEQTGSAIKKYYYAGSMRVAMNDNGTLYFTLGDHLNSTSITADSAGNLNTEMRYEAWGEARYNYGTTPTRYRYTSQREDSEIGLYFYNARMYDSLIGRFASADTIVPNQADPQTLNRFAYGLNNPIKYVDPSGHSVDESGCETQGCATDEDWVDNVIKVLMQPIDPQVICSDPMGELTLYFYLWTMAHATPEAGVTPAGALRDAWTSSHTLIDNQRSHYPGGIMSDATGLDNMLKMGAQYDADILNYALQASAQKNMGPMGSPNNPKYPAGYSPSKGSTANPSKGRVLPRNLREILAVAQARSNPQAGRELPIPMTDNKWLASDGWVKMQLIVNQGGGPVKILGAGGPINVHYAYNKITGAVDDFKIVLPGY